MGVVGTERAGERLSDGIERVREKIKRSWHGALPVVVEFKRKSSGERRKGTDRTWEGGVSECLSALGALAHPQRPAFACWQVF